MISEWLSRALCNFRDLRIVNYCFFKLMLLSGLLWACGCNVLSRYNCRQVSSKQSFLSGIKPLLERVQISPSPPDHRRKSVVFLFVFVQKSQVLSILLGLCYFVSFEGERVLLLFLYPLYTPFMSSRCRQTVVRIFDDMPCS